MSANALENAVQKLRTTHAWPWGDILNLLLYGEIKMELGKAAQLLIDSGATRADIEPLVREELRRKTVLSVSTLHENGVGLEFNAANKNHIDRLVHDELHDIFSTITL